MEALLLKRPMVVAYRLARLTYWLARWLVHLPYFSLPNLLAGRALVPEFLQDEVTPEALGDAVLKSLDDTVTRQTLITAFNDLHKQLRRDADHSAATAVLQLAGR